MCIPVPFGPPARVFTSVQGRSIGIIIRLSGSSSSRLHGSQPAVALPLRTTTRATPLDIYRRPLRTRTRRPPAHDRVRHRCRILETEHAPDAAEALRTGDERPELMTGNMLGRSPDSR